MNTQKIMSILLCPVVVILTISCGSADTPDPTVFPRDASLAEASEVLGIDIPIPQYLPEGYAIKKIVLQTSEIASLMISNEANSKIELRVTWREMMIPWKVIPTTVDISGYAGSLLESDDENSVIWNWKPERYSDGVGVMKLSASKDVPTGELIAVARSIDLE